MSQATTPRTRYAIAGAVFGALLVLLLTGGATLGSPATSRAAQAGDSPGPGAGVSVGPPATLRVVDLRALPPATPGAGKPLPFRYPRGAAALAAAQAAAGPRDTGSGHPPRLQIPLVTSLQIITGFNGINSEESGGAGGACACVPPDGDMAAGPNHVVVGVNQAFAVYNKTGARLAGPVGFDTFFGACGAAGLTSSDPIMVYDPAANRFTVGILRYNSNTQASYVSLAVSQSADPTGSWNQYCFAQQYLGVGSLYDFPHISVGQDALFTTGNLYLPQNEQNVSARVNAYPKTLMYNGALTVTQVFSDVMFNSDMTTADTIRPALFNVGLPSNTNYFINTSSTAGSSRSTVWRWTLPFAPLGLNVLQQAGGVDVATYLPAVSMLQPPPGQPMPPPVYIDTRTLAAMWHNGTLYSAHTAGCNPGAGVTDCIQWYQVGNLGGPPSLIQQGIISGTNETRSYPNLAVDAQGNVRLAYAFSSLNDFIGIRHSGRLASDPLGQMGPESVVVAGQQAEVGYDALRYGDYSGAVTDPDGTHLWHFEEYTQAISDPFGSWGTWASEAQFPAQGTATRTPTPGGPTATRTPTAAPTGTATASATGTQTATALPGAAQFYHNIILDPQRGSGEPSNRVDAFNHAYVSSPFGVGNTSYLWRSQGSDRLTFQPRGILLDHRIPVSPGGGDTDIAVDSLNLLHFFDLYLGNFSYVRSDDQGRTFTSQNPLPGLGTVADDRQWTEAFNNEVYLIYRQIPTGPVANHGMIPGPGLPTVFQTAVPIDDMPAQTSHLGNIVIDKRASGTGAGNAYTVYNNGTQLRLGRTTDHGATWQPGLLGTPIIIANRPARPDNIFPSIAIDNVGNLYVAWSEPGPSSYDIYFTSSTDQGNTWRTPVRVNTPDLHLNIMPWVAAGSDGRVDLVWYGTDAVNSPPDPQTVNPATWYGYYAQTLNGHAAAPTFSQVRFSQTAIHYNGICLGGTGCTTSGGDRMLLDFFEVAVSPVDGAATISYADNTNQTTPPPLAYLMQAQQVGGTSAFVTSTLTLPAGCAGSGTFPCANYALDPAGDAIDPYDGPTAPGSQYPLADMLRSAMGRETSDGVTINMQVNADLAQGATAARPPGPVGAPPLDTYTWLTQFEYKDYVYWVAMDWLQGATQPRFVWGDLSTRDSTQPPVPGTGLGFFSYNERGTLCQSSYTTGTTPSDIYIQIPYADITGRDGSHPTAGSQFYNVTSYGFARHGTTNATLTNDIMEIVDPMPPYVYTLATPDPNLPTPTPGPACTVVTLPTSTVTSTPSITATPSRTPTGTPPTATSTSTAGIPSATRTATPIPPSSTALPTQTPGGPTATTVPSNTPTPVPPSSTPTPVPPSSTAVPPSRTPLPTQTPGGPTATTVPSSTLTPVPPSSTPTPVTPSSTPLPTQTPGGPTATTVPSSTPTVVPPSATAVPPSATPPPTQTPGGPTATIVPSSTPQPSQTPGGPTATTAPSRTPVASATPCLIIFSDVHPADYFYTPVLYLACHGVISGYSDGTYRPYNQTTRSQMVKIVVLGFQKPITTPSGGGYTFTDVRPGFPFFAVIETAAADNIVSGYTCGGPGEPCDPQHRPYFRPYANVTRGQLSKIDTVAAGWALLNPASRTFADVLPGTAFYTFVETASCHGVISGYTCGGPGEPCDAQHRPYFRQYANATRGQIAKIVYLSIVGTAICPASPAAP